MRKRRGDWLLIAPALVILGALFVAPVAVILNESFKTYIPGRVGGVGEYHFTVANYAAMLEPAYVSYFFETFRISLEATLIGVVLGYPIAYFVARQHSPLLRKVSLGFLFSMLFMSILVRVYALILTFGPVGMLRGTASLLGLSPNGFAFAEILVIAGLVHVIVPMIALTLVGTLQNVNPSLEAAAQVLGAPRWKAFFTITVPLTSRGIISAFLIAYTLCISAFVVPLILGKGVVLMVANLIYSRFSEVANYPGGAAIAVLLLLLSLIFVYSLLRLVNARWEQP
jgi:putative spermidine/putrescine transport system permease protein